MPSIYLVELFASSTETPKFVVNVQKLFGELGGQYKSFSYTFCEPLHVTRSFRTNQQMKRERKRETKRNITHGNETFEVEVMNFGKIGDYLVAWLVIVVVCECVCVLSFHGWHLQPLLVYWVSQLFNQTIRKLLDVQGNITLWNECLQNIQCGHQYMIMVERREKNRFKREPTRKKWWESKKLRRKKSERENENSAYT